ncbi:MAG: metallophosphoesterase family protein [Atopobiaceae bacterium]|jgi:serine/threonine protein phosphatase 1|nr:serine/threonine protein phosphatase [Atopobiaceae bacterium]
MATYVLSDVHGRLHALDDALAMASPTQDDRIYMLGDMADRGPDGVGVMQLLRSLPNCTVLRGNHEQFMLDAIDNPNDPYAWTIWSINGGHPTSHALTKLSGDEFGELSEWVRGLPLHEVIEVGGQTYLLVHAGIRPVDDDMLSAIWESDDEVSPAWDPYSLEKMLDHQSPDDLLWIRDEFWSKPTGLVGGDGRGPVVICGHTPTCILETITNQLDRSPVHKGEGDDDMYVQMVRAGASKATGGVPDKWGIDCGAGSVERYGRVLVLRLDDQEEFYAPVRDGE